MSDLGGIKIRTCMCMRMSVEVELPNCHILGGEIFLGFICRILGALAWPLHWDVARTSSVVYSVASALMIIGLTLLLDMRNGILPVNILF